MYGMGISSCASGRFSQVRRVDEPGTSHVEYRYTHNRSTRRGGQVEHGSAAPIQPNPLSCENIGTSIFDKTGRPKNSGLLEFA